MSLDPDVILAWPSSKLAKMMMYDELYPPYDPWWGFSCLNASIKNSDPRRREAVKPGDYYPKVLDEDEQAEEIFRHINGA